MIENLPLPIEGKKILFNLFRHMDSDRNGTVNRDEYAAYFIHDSERRGTGNTNEASKMGKA